MTPIEMRKTIRSGQWRQSTAGEACGYVQSNLVILPASLSSDFRLFCARNPRPCPVLVELTEGSPVVPRFVAHDADIRTDLPSYRIYRDGHLTDEVNDLLNFWREDFIAFLLGCSFSFDGALIEEGLPVRHVEQRKNVPMFITNRDCVPAGKLQGPVVVSYRPMPQELLQKAVDISRVYPLLHGGPVHIGDPTELGIRDLNYPDWGDAVEREEGDIAMFWACGVTPQAVALHSKIPLMISHSPGHMFVTDIPISALRNRAELKGFNQT